MNFNYLKVLITILFLLITKLSFTQNLNWVKNIRSYNASSSIDITASTKDIYGNIYNIGPISGTADFDASIAIYNVNGNLNGKDLFIQKLDNAGNFIWAKRIGGITAEIEGKNIKAFDTSIYIIGVFDSTVDFNPDLNFTNNVVKKGPKDAFVLKLDSSGTFNWVKTFGSPTSTLECNALDISSNNEILVGGTFNDIVDFDPNATTQYLSTNSSSDPYLLKLSFAGNYLWAKSLAGSVYGSIVAIQTALNNDIIICGNYIGTLNLNPSTTTLNSISSQSNSTDVFMSKYTISGNFKEGKSIGGNNEDFVADMKLNDNQEIVLAGYFSGTCDFDPNLNNFSLIANGLSEDCYVAKYNNNFDLLWAKKIGGNGDDRIVGLALDNLNNIYTTGYFTGTVDFNPNLQINNLTSNGDNDVFISKLDDFGQYLNSNNVGGQSNDIGTTIMIENSLSIIISGSFNGTVDFDPTAATNSLVANTSTNADLYTLNWLQCSPDLVYINSTGCNNTFNGQTYTSNGTYNQNYTNMYGCDSVVQINITGSATNTIQNISTCNSSYTLNSQTYSNSGTYIQNYTNTSGCDSSYTLNLLLNVPNFKTVNVDACNFYFWANQLYFTSGTYVKVFSNVAGCDSTVTLNLTIFQTITDTVYQTTCGPIMYNGSNYNASGVYNNIFSSVNSCDSIVDLILTIVPISPTYIVDTACYLYTYNGQNYASSGQYSEQFFSVDGCDSTIILNLTIYNLNKTIAQNNNILSSNQLMPATYQWFSCNPLTLINGANARDYTVTSNGSYGVIVSANGCTDTSTCFSVIIDGIENFGDNKNFIISPNPATAFLNIEFNKKSEDGYLKIYSSLGNQILSVKFGNNSTLSIPINHLSSGLYFVEYVDSKNKIVSKFIKE
jgi:hypothetical protein